MVFSLIAALYDRNIREPEYKSECSPGSVTTRNLDRLGWFLNQKDCFWRIFHWWACIVCNIELMRDIVQRCPSDWDCPWPRKELRFSPLSSSDWRFDVQKCTAPGRLGGQMGSLDKTKYNTRIEQKQEDWLLGKVEEMVGIGMLSSHCELWSFHCLWSGLTCQDKVLHEMSMAERYNENMEKSKEYRTWLEAKQTCTKVPREVSLVSNLLRWLCFRLFSELGSLPGCYEGLSHMSSSGSNCGNDRRHDERVQADLLQKLARICWIVGWDDVRKALEMASVKDKKKRLESYW